MDMYVNGAYKMVDLGYVKEIKEASVVFIVDAGEIEVEVDAVTKDAIEMINQADEEALIPLDIKEKAVILEGEPA
ncbi:ABC transporter substrate-binding protein [Oceanobacillus picturae]|uniref:ABC transporter substrate-binding protein n=3 Tax=Bacillaceae TaxID=186817 RepID=A0A0U9HHS7_9BACI|nr:MULTISPECIES: hypothetical protein [Bacillaceae]GAQ18460.1 ABC transporter substrate-binding protein [Oceanobacillus picturae]